MKDYILNLDKPRQLKFGFKASRLIREKFGDKDFRDIGNMHMDEMPTVAWAGLVWEDQNLSVEKVEEMLDKKIPEFYTIIQCMEVIVEAVAAHIGAPSIPTQKKKKKTKKKQPEKKIPSKKIES